VGGSSAPAPAGGGHGQSAQANANKRKSEESRCHHRAAHSLNSMREQCTPPRSRLFVRLPEVSFKFVLDAFFLPSLTSSSARRQRRAESTQAHRTSRIHAVAVRPRERDECGRPQALRARPLLNPKPCLPRLCVEHAEPERAHAPGHAHERIHLGWPRPVRSGAPVRLRCSTCSLFLSSSSTSRKHGRGAQYHSEQVRKS